MAAEERAHHWMNYMMAANEHAHHDNRGEMAADRRAHLRMKLLEWLLLSGRWGITAHT